LRTARREIVDVRGCRLVGRVVIERERSPGGLHRNRSARALGVLLLRFRIGTALRFRVGAEVAAAGRLRRSGIERARRSAGEPAGARSAESARPRPAEPTGAARPWPARAAIFAGAGLTDGERASVEHLSVE